MLDKFIQQYGLFFEGINHEQKCSILEKEIKILAQKYPNEQKIVNLYEETH